MSKRKSDKLFSSKITKDKASSSSLSQDKNIAASQVLVQGFGKSAPQRHYLEYVSMKERCWDERELMQICHYLLAWVRDETRDQNDNKITNFFTNLGMHYSTVMRLRERYDFFDEACLLALQVLGDYREKKGLMRDWSERLVIKSMPQYDRGWVAESEREAKLKSDIEQESGIRVVHIPTYIEVEKKGKKEDDNNL